jgi:hypothetical protein
MLSGVKLARARNDDPRPLENGRILLTELFRVGLLSLTIRQPVSTPLFSADKSYYSHLFWYVLSHL